MLLLAEVGQVNIIVCEQVVAETERAVARKIPRALSNYRKALRATGLSIVGDPSPKGIEAHKNIISHLADVPIIVAAMKVQADYLVTLNRRHFVDDPNAAARSGLRIGTPGDALAWVRGRLRKS